MNTDLQESLAPMLRSPTIFKRPCVVSSVLPTLNQRIVNLTYVTMDGCGPAGKFRPDDNLGLDGCGLGGYNLWPAKIRRPGWACHDRHRQFRS